MANPQTAQDAVSLRTLQVSEARLLEQTTATADTAVSDANKNHVNILNHKIRVKSLDLSPDGSTEWNINMSNHRIVRLKDADPEIESEAVNIRTLNKKILEEIGVNNQLESLKYLRLDGQNQITAPIQMNGNKLVGLTNATALTDGVNLRTLDGTVNSLRSEN